jgi:hypothetical protein
VVQPLSSCLSRLNPSCQLNSPYLATEFANVLFVFPGSLGKVKDVRVGTPDPSARIPISLWVSCLPIYNCSFSQEVLILISFSESCEEKPHGG